MESAWERYFREDLGEDLGVEARLIRAFSRNAARFNLEPESPALALEMARFLSYLTPLDHLAVTALLLSCIADMRQGSTRSPLRLPGAQEQLLRRFQVLCQEPPPQERESPWARRLFERLQGLLQDRQLQGIVAEEPEAQDRPFLLLEGWLYPQRMWAAEQRLASSLGARLRSPLRFEPRAHQALEEVVRCPREPALSLSNEQLQAVVEAAQQSLTLIAGGPGTGKTSIVVALLQTLVRLGTAPRQLLLAAPTGKAAWRMRESIREGLAALKAPAEADLQLAAELPDPQTLHRLLGYSPRNERFLHHSNNPISAEVLIVDESSMIDLFLMERLSAALAPRCRLVLLGDADQLPSVAAGAVFRDLLAAPIARPKSLRLSRNFRMRADNPGGRSILEVAWRVKRGDPALKGWERGTALIQARRRVSELKRQGVELLPTDHQNLWAFLRWWLIEELGSQDQALCALRERIWSLELEERPALERLFKQQANARLLCLTRSFETGSERLNARLHAILAQEAGRSPDGGFLPGAPVMMLHNDYDRQLFNGDQGLVLHVQQPGGWREMVIFPGETGPRCFSLDSLRGRLELCYAMTVHKAQGSEFDQVGVMLPLRDGPLLSRELLYTAMTRSRRGVIFLGEMELLERAVCRKTQRHSGLSESLERGER